MRGINIGGLTERRAFRHFVEELIIICQQEPGLKYWGGALPPPEKYWGAPAPPSYAYVQNNVMYDITARTRAPPKKWVAGLVHTVCACATYSVFPSVNSIVHLREEGPGYGATSVYHVTMSALLCSHIAALWEGPEYEAKLHS